MMDKRQGNYKDHYGIIPEFTAWMHYGFVTTGEIGQIKKEIVFTGDILNTTARIQKDLLISAELTEKVSEFSSRFQFESVGRVVLRDKSEAMELYTASRSD